MSGLVVMLKEYDSEGLLNDLVEMDNVCMWGLVVKYVASRLSVVWAFNTLGFFF